MREVRPVPETDRIPLHALALNAAADAAPPDWVQLMPAGGDVAGVDGRRWKVESAEAVVAAFNAGGRTLPVDIEHASEHKAPKGEPAPAVGWIEAMEVRGGEIWGRVSWNAAGEEAIRTRAYRYLSPVFLFSKGDRVVRRLVSAGLTNIPNFNMTALNRASEQEETDMSLAAIRAALNLGEDAGETAIVTAINTMKSEYETALNAARAAPDLERFVPKATYEAAVNRADAAECELRKVQDAAAEQEIETAVNAAIEGKKIAPADRDFYVAACRAEGGLDRFRDWAKTTPQIAAPSGLDGKQPKGGGAGLSEDERAACRALGVSEAEFIRARAAEKEEA